MRVLQWIFIVMLLIGFSFKFLHLAGANEFMLSGLGGLGTLYFFFGFAIFNDVPLSGMFKKASFASITRNQILTAEALGIGLSLGLIGIAFKILTVENWFLPIGVIITTIVVGVGLFSGIADNQAESLRRHLLYKGVPVVLLGAALLFTPVTTLIRFWNRDMDPAYVEKLIYVREHPEDEQARKELEEMQRNLY